MVEMGANPTYVAFVRELRRALYRLYDPLMLRRSPLVHLLGLNKERGSSELQNALCEAIEGLKPDHGSSPEADIWCIYNILRHRFVDQFSQQEVATGLGLSIRHMRRKESMALRALADSLCARYDIDLAPAEHKPQTPAADTIAPDVPLADNKLEFQWLERAYPSEVVDVKDVIGHALDLATPLIQTLGVQVHCSLADDLPSIVAQATTLRQALLNVFTTTAGALPGGEVEIRGEARGQQVYIYIRPAGEDKFLNNWAEHLDIARQLVGLSGGSMRVIAGEGTSVPAALELALPVAASVKVLFIDDNADALRLYQRYLIGSRYLGMFASDAEQALAFAESCAPAIVVLDVMLPGVDGWELLGRLRVHPQTQGAPIIVCTILPLEQFSLTLGAAGYLRKPLSREALLSALDRQLPPVQPGTL